MFQTFELLYEVHNPVEADILADLLRGNDVTVRLLGSRDANILGVGQNILALRLEVPVSQLETARRVLDEFLKEGGAEHLRHEGLLDDADEADAHLESTRPVWGMLAPLVGLLGAAVCGLGFARSSGGAVLVGTTLAAFSVAVAQMSILRSRGAGRRKRDLAFTVLCLALCATAVVSTM